MLEPAMFVGLGAVAVWAYFRYPRLRPGSLVWATVHVAVSFGVFMLLPTALDLLLPAVPSQTLRPYLVLALLIPELTYVLLSWVWLIARILHDLLGGTPRGGHPRRDEVLAGAPPTLVVRDPPNRRGRACGGSPKSSELGAAFRGKGDRQAAALSPGR